MNASAAIKLSSKSNFFLLLLKSDQIGIFNETFKSDYLEEHDFVASNEIVDFFDPIFAAPYFKLVSVITYLISMICAICKCFVIWFEVSGQAGHYRTLVNQMVTLNLLQVIMNIIFRSPPKYKILFNRGRCES